jgi:hypothetical protein
MAANDVFARQADAVAVAVGEGAGSTANVSR